jgi:hypothetical protein
MDDTERIRKRILVFRNNDKMYMVIHKTVCEDVQMEFPAVVGNKIKILPSVSVILKYILPIATSLGNVIKISCSD